MKKKIIFMLINMNVGGTEKALLNMISEIPKDQYDITIYMLEKYGGFLNSIPSDVHIEYFKGYKNIKAILNNPPHLTAMGFLKKGKVIKAITIIMLHLISKIANDRSCFFKYVLFNYPELKNEYDVAVAFDGPMDFISHFVVNRIKAKKKIQWIHFDVTKIGFNPGFASKLYKKFDNVFTVSKEAKIKLLNLVPSINLKTDHYINVPSKEVIKQQAEKDKGFIDNFEGLRILTVGRLSTEKGQDLAILALAKLIKDGYKVRWYCVGEGSSRQNYESLIEEYQLKNHFILLGSDPNPYPYIDQCDIYVQPSKHEGYCITLAEARCLNKPIVTTNFISAKEHIKDGENGLVVGIEPDEIYMGVTRLINNSELRQKFSVNLAKQDFSTKNQLNQLYKILN